MSFEEQLESLFIAEGDIPAEYRLDGELHQREYLCTGELRHRPYAYLALMDLPAKL
jgi:glyceraldehyde-3-phosphate dehydrogenase (NADP+)